MKIVSLILTILWMTLHPLTAWCERTDTLAVADTLTVEETQPQKMGLIRRIIRGFDRLDTRYIEPQHYVFTVMLQGTYTYDFYTLRSYEGAGQSVSFAPDGSLKLGPFIGWKWIFGGYTFTLGSNSFNKRKTEFDFSIYSSQIGIDLFYRRTGSDYKLRDVHIGDRSLERSIEDLPFDGIKAGITGVNLYYIFNHGRFSYPAAFAQSTRQKISCGSWMAGIGYTRNSLEFDYRKLQEMLDERASGNQVKIDSGLMFKSAHYYDASISGGYAYNWVFAPRWLLCASGQLALAYKQSTGKTAGSGSDNPFSFVKFNPNLVGRFGLVYNNDDWYTGLSAIVRSNYYFESRFSTHNTFGSMNIYIGYNFGLKKKYRDKK